LTWQEGTEMKTVFVILIILIVLGFVGGTAHTMNPFSMVVAIVAIGVFGGVLREFAKDGGKKTSKAETIELNDRIARIEADIADIKEQIADFIINQV
jgi:hypothetical protein